MWIARARESFLNFYQPVPTPTPNHQFRYKWRKPANPTSPNPTSLALSGVGDDSDWQNPNNWVFPNLMELSEGLILPGWVVESQHQFPLARYKTIQQCMEDLVEYVLSGRHTADFLSEENCAERERSILRIAVEEGVELDNGKW